MALISIVFQQDELGNNPAKFHPDPIWNYGALGFLKRSPQQKEQQQQQ